MGTIRRSRASQRDYLEIWDYLAANAGESIADRQLRAFDEKIALLAEFPFLGVARPELRPRLRSFPVGKYIIFYRPTTTGIQLIRVLHGKRNLPDQFRK